MGNKITIVITASFTMLHHDMSCLTILAEMIKFGQRTEESQVGKKQQ
jgi:hypothetical protein